MTKGKRRSERGWGESGVKGTNVESEGVKYADEILNVYASGDACD